MSRALHSNCRDEPVVPYREDPMRRTGVLWGAVAAITIVISGCSKTEGTKPAPSEQAAGQPGAVGTGGAGANVKSDDDFVRDVALKNMAEIELGRRALARAAG